MTTKTTRPLFEHVTCGRCAGSGRYSWNAMNGDRCFGCGGSGFTLTKRGRAAQRFLNDMRMIAGEDFKVGDTILLDGCGVMASHWCRVTKVSFGKGAEMGYLSFPDADVVRIDSEIIKPHSVHETRATFHGIIGQSKFRKGFSAEEKAENRRLALAYQDTLTKAGTVRANAEKVTA